MIVVVIEISEKTINPLKIMDPLGVHQPQVKTPEQEFINKFKNVWNF